MCSIKPPPKLSRVSRKKRRRLFTLQRLCLFYNRLISSASIPTGQLTNTVTLSWKDWQTQTHTPYHAGSIVHLSKFLIVIHKLPARTSIFQVASATIICLQWFDILPYESLTGMYLQATPAYHTYYTSKQKAEQNKEKSWLMPAFTMDQKQLAVVNMVANAWVTLVLAVILLNSNRFSLWLLKYKEDCTTVLSVVRCLKQRFFGLNWIYQQLTSVYPKILNTLSQR